MLILTRRVGERLIIDGEIVVSIEQINSLQVKIGIDAPRHVPVHRQEVFERIQAEVRASRVAGPEVLAGAVELHKR